MSQVATVSDFAKARAEEFDCLSPRVHRLLEQYHSAQPEVFAERALLVTKAYAATEGQPMPLRQSASLSAILDGVTVLIRNDELIVGCKTPGILGAPLYPELACDWVEAEIDTMADRSEAPFIVNEETKEILRREVFDYWRGKQVSNRLMEALPVATMNAVDEGLLFHYFLTRSIGHLDPDYERVLRKGFIGLRREVEAELASMDGEHPGYLKKLHQLRAMAMACDAAIRFVGRYADEAERLARLEGNDRRRAGLEEIARVCRRVPAHRAETFHEALQAFWFVHLILNLESNGYAMSPGRFDQYLEPYFSGDLAAGRIDEDGARELLACLWIKLNELTIAKDGGTAKQSTTYNDFQNLNLGGVTVDGRDATNRLSYLCLEVTGALKLPLLQVSVLISAQTPERFLIEACRVIRTGIGMPSVFNDDEKVLALVQKGRTLEDARRGALNGCVEITVPGKDRIESGGYVNMVKCLELALNDGLNPVTGNRVGPSTGEAGDFGTFEEFLEAFRVQLGEAIRLKIVQHAIAKQVYGAFFPVPYTSLLVSDCLETGLDYHDGGSHYKVGNECGVGTGTLADSLAAIKTLVFDQKKLTLPQLVKVLREDFAGAERERQLLINRAPKWGNGDEEVDSLARRVVDMFCEELVPHTNENGESYAADMIPTTTHIYFGGLTGATPDGRRAGVPLSEGGPSPRTRHTRPNSRRPFFGSSRPCADRGHVAQYEVPSQRFGGGGGA